MRRVTILWFLIAACLGVALFLLKYEVQDREERLAAIHREILANQEAVHVLEAEWSYLNRPSNLENLVRRYLDLVPLDTTRLGQLDHLPMRLEFPDALENGEDSAVTTAPQDALTPGARPWPAPPAPIGRPLAISAGVRQ